MTLIVFLYVSNLLTIVYGLLSNARCRHKTFRHTAYAILNMVMIHVGSSFFVFFFSPNNNFSFVSIPINLLYAALCYLLYKTIRQWRVGLGDLVHLVPFLFGTLFYAFFMSNDIWRYSYFHYYVLLMDIFCAALYTFYGLLIVLQVYNTEGMSQRKAKRVELVLLFAVFILLIMGASIAVLTTDDGNLHSFQSFSLLYQGIILLTIVYLIHLAKLKEIAVAIITFNAMDDAKVEKAPVPTQIKLSKEQEQLYALEIEKFVGQKMYLDIDMNKERFCALLAVPRHHVSPFLKVTYGKSFSNFVNQLRLRYAAKQLQQEDFVYTIDDLSFICGFKSRASFYRNFIAEFDCSPHEYRNKYIA